MVIEVSEASFAHEVLERSLTTPVIVDFWAAWCAPCRALGPVLEQAVEAHQGEVVLAKVDVDANPRLQERYGVRGIPAVKAFREGQVVSEFVGAQPRPAGGGGALQRARRGPSADPDPSPPAGGGAALSFSACRPRPRPGARRPPDARPYAATCPGTWSSGTTPSP